MVVVEMTENSRPEIEKDIQALIKKWDMADLFYIECCLNSYIKRKAKELRI